MTEYPITKKYVSLSRVYVIVKTQKALRPLQNDPFSQLRRNKRFSKVSLYIKVPTVTFFDSFCDIL